MPIALYKKTTRARLLSQSNDGWMLWVWGTGCLVMMMMMMMMMMIVRTAAAMVVNVDRWKDGGTTRNSTVQ
jgi:hypothetical protein